MAVQFPVGDIKKNVPIFVISTFMPNTLTLKKPCIFIKYIHVIMIIGQQCRLNIILLLTPLPENLDLAQNILVLLQFKLLLKYVSHMKLNTKIWVDPK